MDTTTTASASHDVAEIAARVLKGAYQLTESELRALATSVFTVGRVGEAQGLPVAGYKPTQPAWAIAAVNDLKHVEERAHRLLDGLLAQSEAVDHRALQLARTGIQQAFMWAARGVFQPGRVTLPEDGQPLFNSDAKGG